MRFAMTLVLSCLVLAPAAGQKHKANSGKRYLINPDLDAYPQDTPQKALGSVIKAMQDKKIDYLLAQLTDPRFVDRQVQRQADALKAKGNDKVNDLAAFEELVKEVTAYLTQDPTLLKDLKAIAKGDWDRGETAASASAKDNKEKRAFFRKIGNRWYFENRQKEKTKS